VARVRDLDYVGIDPFPVEEVWESWIENFAGMSPCVYKEKSTRVNGIGKINAILIDGEHSYESVLADVTHFEPCYVSGTFLMFHDYQRESLPEVTEAVDEYMAAHPEWLPVNVFGTLGIWRKK
jgi:cephalosporin hydroxylase